MRILGFPESAVSLKPVPMVLEIFEMGRHFNLLPLMNLNLVVRHCNWGYVKIINYFETVYYVIPFILSHTKAYLIECGNNNKP